MVRQLALRSVCNALQQGTPCLEDWCPGLEDSGCGGGLQDGSMVIHGGYDGQNTFGDTYVLTTSDWTWRQLVTTGKASMRFTKASRHTLTVICSMYCSALLLHQVTRLLHS